MTKTWIVVAIVGVLAVGGYFVLKSNKINETAVTNGQNESVQPNGKKVAFSEFIKQGGAYKCEVKQAMSDFENSGTVYINGNNMMGEYSTVAEGRTMSTSFMMKDGYSYTWSSALPNMGFKVKIPANTDADASADASGTYSWNANQIGDYNCEPWTPDQTKFVLPANITFKDYSGMMQNK